MRKYHLFETLLLVLLLLFSLSCEEKSTSSREGTDFEAIKNILRENPDIFLTDVFDGRKDTLVNPIFYREITSRNFDLEEGTTINPPNASNPFEYVYATWEDSIKGVFHYFVDGKEYTKPIYAYSEVNAYLERWGDIYDTHRGWLLKEISGNVIASVPTSVIPPPVHILSEEVDRWVTQGTVLNLVKKDSVLQFKAGKEVTFEVESDYLSNIFLFLHIGEDGNFKKIAFEDNQDGTHSASWTTTSDPNLAKGYKHAFVDAINQMAATDTNVQYDAKALGIIYKIK